MTGHVFSVKTKCMKVEYVNLKQSIYILQMVNGDPGQFTDTWLQAHFQINIQ